MTFSLLIQPHAHDAIGGGVIEDLFGAVPTGLGLIALAMAANKQADEEADNDDRNDDENDEAHFSLRLLEGDGGAVRDDLGQ